MVEFAFGRVLAENCVLTSVKRLIIIKKKKNKTEGINQKGNREVICHDYRYY